MALQASKYQRALQRDVVDKGLDLDSQPLEHEQPQQSIFNRETIVLLLILMVFKIQEALNNFIVRGAFPFIRADFHPMPERNFIMKMVCTASYIASVILFSIMVDHYSRKTMMCGGIILKILASLASSYVPSQYFAIFLVMRALSNVADGCFTPIHSSIITDLVIKEKRFWLLAFFQLCVLIGNGLGYILSYKILGQAGLNWRWLLRVVPGFSVLTIQLIIIFMKEPPRRKTSESVPKVSLSDAFKVVRKNHSLLFTIIGSAVMPFISRGVEIWAYAYMHHAREVVLKDQICHSLLCVLDDKMLVRSCSILSMIFGLVIGSKISHWCRKFSVRADPILCVVCLLTSAPLLSASLIFIDNSPVHGYILLSLVEMLMTIATTVTCNIRMSVSAPETQSLAKALHLISTNVLGQLSSATIFHWIDKEAGLEAPVLPAVQRIFISLQYDLLLYPFVAVLGSGFYLATSVAIVKDYKARSYLLFISLRKGDIIQAARLRLSAALGIEKVISFKQHDYAWLLPLTYSKNSKRQHLRSKAISFKQHD
ncbi:PREDICTED: protein spinster homolog 1-like [Nanorana parkeri]|uniref:protein spinster homolog 1-like n=1 Tax=Nanorana parkeri TaxID=125878 RepID=UPI000854C1CC|nr:PREDICTED: protein spinster homolog 1-like [Nanorana parkeri]